MARRFRFGNVEVRPAERVLLVGGHRADIGARAFDVLVAMVERRGHVVSKDELMQVVWPDTIVEENNLEAQVSALRKAIGAQAFATVRGRGYQFTLETDEAFPDPAPAPSAPTNIPPAHSELLGRRADVAALVELVHGKRLVTVFGPGGVGKTRLAQEAARAAVAAHPHGVWWVDLAVVDEEAVAATIARTLGLPVSVADPDGELAAALESRNTLVVLDNCEHVAARVAAIARTLLDSAPQVRLLATSQVVLGIADENLFQVEGLAVPPPDVALEEARGYGAIALLEHRMQGHDRRLRIEEGNLAAAVELCGRLDGNALAIEMAAARVATLGFGGLRALLGERLKLLRAARDAGERHSSLRAMLESSYSLLDEREKEMLRRLSTFAGSFPLQLARGVCAGAMQAQEGDIDVLAALVAKSMVQVERAEPVRYRLLETTRLFAADALERHGEAASAHRDHGEAMRRYAEDANRTYWRGGPEWLARHAAQYADLQAAFERACAAGEARVAGPTAQVLTFLDMAANGGSRMLTRKLAAHALLERAAGRERAQLLNAINCFRILYAPPISRIDIARARVQAWRELGDRAELFEALARYAGDCAVAGDFAAADRALAEARELEDAAWPLKLRMWLLNFERVVTMYRGDGDRYRAQAGEMLRLARGAGDRGRVALAQVLLAEAAAMCGDDADAMSHVHLAFEELESFAQPNTHALALIILTGILIRTGKVTDARVCGRRAAAPAWRWAYTNWLCDHLALLAARTGLPEHAAQLLGIADAGYVVNQDSRQPLEDRAARETMPLIVEALGAPAVSTLRREASLLAPEMAQRVIQEVVAA